MNIENQIIKVITAWIDGQYVFIKIKENPDDSFDKMIGNPVWNFQHYEYKLLEDLTN